MAALGPRLLWWALFLGHAALIFWLSDGPLPEGVLPAWPGSDKLYHAGQFGLFALLGLQAVLPRGARPFWLTVLGCWLYGLSDELHQAWVPGRESDFSDWLADGAGILAAAGLWWRARRALQAAGD